MSIEGQFVKQLADPLGGIYLLDLSFDYVFEIKLHKFEIFACETLIHKIEPQRFEATSQRHYLNIIAYIDPYLQLLMAL